MSNLLRLSALAGLWAFLVTGELSAQQMGTIPFQTREPPFAGKDDTPEPALLPAGVLRKSFDPDEQSDVKQAQFTTPGATTNPPPAPGTYSPMPSRGSPNGVGGQIGGAELLLPAGELPTPVVSLDVEGSEVSPSGQAVVYRITVRNNSRARAHHVVVRVVPPKNAEKVKAEPQATADEAETRWELKTLEPGQSRVIEVAYKPKQDADEVKIQARVQFDFGRGMITKVSAPSVTIKKEGPEKVVVGDTVTYRIVVQNNGRVTVRDLEVQEMIDKGLTYEDRELSRGTVDGRLMSSIDPKSGERMWSIPALSPGQSQVIEYRVKAKTTGKLGSTVHVKGNGILKQTTFDTEVLTAQLQIQAEGPAAEKGMVGQAASYRVVVANRGSAELKNVCVRCLFPPDMKPTRATNSGQSFRESVQWIFEKMAPGETKEVKVSLNTSVPGTRALKFVAKADKGKEQEQLVRTEFVGVPSLSWDADIPPAASVGRNFTYKVTVSNTGTAPAKNVQLKLDLPPNVDFVSSSPDSSKGFSANSKLIIFQPYEIPAAKKTTYTIEVKARSAGNAPAVFTLTGEGVGPEGAENRNSTTITGFDSRSPTGPPPQIDRSKVGSSPIKD